MCLLHEEVSIMLMKETNMNSITDGSIIVQASSQSVPSTPPWFGEVALIVQYLRKHEILSAIAERVRFARRRFGQYEVIDFVAVLFGYAISGERTLEAFYQNLHPFASAFMALFGRERLPARSTLSRFLAALPSEPVEALRALFLSDLLARPLVPEGEPAGLWDRTGSQWQVFDIDGTREAARQRALPQGPERASHPSVAYVRSVLRATLGGSEEKLSAPEPRSGPRSYPSMARLVRWARQWLGTRGITPSRGPDPAVPCGPSVASSMRAAEARRTGWDRSHPLGRRGTGGGHAWQRLSGAFAS